MSTVAMIELPEKQREYLELKMLPPQLDEEGRRSIPHFTLEEMAHKLGVAVSTLKTWERSKRFRDAHFLAIQEEFASPETLKTIMHTLMEEGVGASNLTAVKTALELLLKVRPVEEEVDTTDQDLESLTDQELLALLTDAAENRGIPITIGEKND